jgi:hypothetical protein
MSIARKNLNHSGVNNVTYDKIDANTTCNFSGTGSVSMPGGYSPAANKINHTVKYHVYKQVTEHHGQNHVVAVPGNLCVSSGSVVSVSAVGIFNPTKRELSKATTSIVIATPIKDAKLVQDATNQEAANTDSVSGYSKMGKK